MKKALFVDIGGVLLTNGWDEAARERASSHFGLDLNELNKRHKEIFSTYELGKISLHDYIRHTVFYKKRDFSLAQFESFIFEQSSPFEEMLKWVRQIKKEHHLKVFAVSNEGKEITLVRIAKFKLDELIDTFVVSSFVHLSKPDPAIYRLALDLASVPPEQVIYIEDRLLFVETAKELGISSIQHINQKQTSEQFLKMI